MALISCPECHREISDQAKACPHCGCPIAVELNQLKQPGKVSNETGQETTEDIRTSSSGTKVRSRKKVVIIGIAIVSIALAVTFAVFGGKVTANNVGSNAVFNTSLGVGVKIGQSKDSVDKLLGNPSMEYGWYVYSDHLLVDYINGKVASLLIQYPNDAWTTKGGISIGSSENDVRSIYSEPEIAEDPNDWYYYLNRTGSKVAYMSQVNHGVLFKMNGGKVIYFQISNNFISE